LVRVELQLVRQVAIGSRRVAIGPSSCNWYALSCNWSVKLQLVRVELQLVRQVAIGSAAKLQVATAGSVHLLYRMHLGAF
jgi:hypothetical protein